MTNQFKNPIFWSALLFVAGIGIGAWGLIKEDSDNYIGSGTIIGVGVGLIVLGALGMFVLGNNKKP